LLLPNPDLPDENSLFVLALGEKSSDLGWADASRSVESGQRPPQSCEQRAAVPPSLRLAKGPKRNQVVAAKTTGV
jgi:hypothetical protein